MLWYLPVMPIQNRYPEEWYFQFKKEFEKHDIDYTTIDGDMQIPVKVQRKEYDLFTSLDLGAKWELTQLQKLLESSDNIKDKDVIFFTDVDFPGFCLPFAQLIKLKVPGVKLFGYLHAGSYCNGDIFCRTPGKIDTEKATIKLFEGIFVGSNYHRNKIKNRVHPFGNIHVVGAPFYYDKLPLKFKELPPEFDILYSTRIDSQDDGKDFIKVVEDNPNTSFVCTFKPPKELNNLTHYSTSNRAEYFELLSKCHAYLTTAKESTFGYAALESLAAGLIPILPRKFSFPEIIGNLGIYYSRTTEINDSIKIALNKKTFRDKEISRKNRLFKNYELSIKIMLDIMIEE